MSKMLICQLTDLHVRPRGMAANRVSETNMLAERAFRVASAFTPRPDVAILTGDLTECGGEAEYENLAAILARSLSMPAYVIPGNHDRRETLRLGLGHLPGVTDDPQFVQYAVEDHPVRLVMLDTLVPGESHGALSAAQLAWLDRTLAAEPEKPTLVGMHHPPFVTGIPHMDKIALRDAEAFRAVIARHSQVRRIVCGHHHRPIVGQCAQAVVSVAPSVAHQVELTFDPADPGAFNFEPPAFQLHKWDERHGFVSHTVYTDHYAGPFPFLTE
ncbi:MAG TPA: phosphodiesterase [Rhodopila sp.]|jgi:Icc protein|nr:phosphodiesterase [Rhodopila sp.]